MEFEVENGVPEKYNGTAEDRGRVEDGGDNDRNGRDNFLHFAEQP